jgi:hypothetical protein
MSLSLYFLGSFKRGQFDITSECKEKSETGNIISIDDGDVTTYIYEKINHFEIKELRGFVSEAFGAECNYVATFNENEGNISVAFNGSIDNEIEGIENILFYDEDGDEEYWDVFTGNKENLLVTSAYESVEEVLKDRPELSISK